MGRGAPLNVAALISPEQMVDGVKRLILDDVRLMLDCPVTVRLLRESKSRVLYAVSSINWFKLLKPAVCISTVPVAGPVISRLVPREIVVSPVSFNTIAFAALINRSFP